MFAPMPISDDQKKKLEGLAWRTFTRLVLASAGAVGAKLGERAVEWLLGDSSDDDGDDDDNDGDSKP